MPVVNGVMPTFASPSPGANACGAARTHSLTDTTTSSGVRQGQCHIRRSHSSRPLQTVVCTRSEAGASGLPARLPLRHKAHSQQGCPLAPRRVRRGPHWPLSKGSACMHCRWHSDCPVAWPVVQAPAYTRPAGADVLRTDHAWPPPISPGGGGGGGGVRKQGLQGAAPRQLPSVFSSHVLRVSEALGL